MKPAQSGEELRVLRRRGARWQFETSGGTGVVNRAGARLVADLADATGLSTVLSVAMAPTRRRRRGHDRGEVLVDLAVMIADGGEAISDLAVLRERASGKLTELIERRREELQDKAFALGERLYADKAKTFVRSLQEQWTNWDRKEAARHLTAMSAP